MSKPIIFNINQTVMVKLTKTGHDELKRQHDEFKQQYPRSCIYYEKRKEDESGFSKWQMHDLMNTFGHMITLGAELPFETEIKLDVA